MSVSLRERRNDRRHNNQTIDIMSEDMEHDEERVVKKARKDKSSGPMDKWVEPTVASKPSFEDHNGQPYGVLENMQPLGEIPSAKMKAKARKSVGRNAGLSNGATPEGTPQPQTKTAASTKKRTPPPSSPPSYNSVEEVESSEVPIRQADDSEDEDYAPQLGKNKARPLRVRPQLKTRPFKKSAPVSYDTSRGDRSATSGASRDPIAPEMQEANRLYPAYTPAKVKEVVEEAKMKARANGNPELANAVNETYEESLRNPKVHLLLLKVLTKDANDDDLDAFQGHVKLAKRRLARRLKTSIARANAARTASNTPARTQSPEKTNLGDKKRLQSVKAESQEPPKFTIQITQSDDQPQKQNKRKERQKSGAKRDSARDSASDTAAERLKVTQNNSLSESQKVEDKSKSVSQTDAVSTNNTKSNEPQSRTTRVRTEQSTGRRVQSHSPSPATQVRLTTRSKASPAPVAKTTKQTESTKAVASTTQPSLTQEPDADTPRKRRQRMNEESELSELTDFEDDDVNMNGNADSDRAKSLPAEEDSLAPPVVNNKRSSAQAELDNDRIEAHNKAIAAKKRKLLGDVRREYEYEDSYERTKISSPAKATRGATALNGIDTVMTNGNGAHDSDSSLSSPTMTERSSPPPFVAAKLNGQRAKTKQSPSKKPFQNAATRPGLGGVGQKDNAAMDIGDSDAEASENSDYCSACHASGFLVCCDGCERAFHFTCLDPPLSAESEELNEPWFCYICVAKRQLTEGQTEKPTTSIRLFAPLFNSLSKQNPTIFSLPQDLQDHFEGVGANATGEYVERLADGKLSRRKTANSESVDAYKLIDKKFNFVFCYHCQETSQGTRAIVSCDYCNQSWHLDCLDPPLAMHPCIDSDGKKRRDWMCPLHVDHEMRYLSARALYHQQDTRHVRVRRPKKAKVIETSLSRGHRNNGIIEIANEDEDNSDSEFYTERITLNNEEAVVKLPETGIKLDFIERIKQNRIQTHRNAQAYHSIRGQHSIASANGVVSTLAKSAATQANLAQHSLRDQRTAFTLTQFARAPNNADLALTTGLDALIAGLVAEAPEKVVTASEDEERSHLLHLQELISRRLAVVPKA